MNDLPEAVKYIIVGGGVHGLSTAWHLAQELTKRGRGRGADIILLDKAAPGAGASGIACGCVRNFYMTEPIHALLRHSVDVWMDDPVAFGFQQVGYVSVGEENQIADYEKIQQSQNRVGYPSEMFVGREAHRFLKNIWPDFNLAGVSVALHEKVSGYAGTRQVINGLTQKCIAAGVRIFSGVEVIGYETTAGAVSKVLTNQGKITCDLVVLGLGAWTPKHWQMLGNVMELDCHYPNGDVVHKDMWTYWRLLEGEVYYDKPYVTPDGLNPPVLHVELMNTPVVDENGHELDDHLYIYYKNGNERMDRPGLQGGTIPIKLGPHAETDPYGHANDDYQAKDSFADYMCAAMAQTMDRFAGIRPHFRQRRNGGIGAFTPDNIPVFDWAAPNVYMIADSNHGFKMLGAGKLVAKFLMGDEVGDLRSFAFSRFQDGRTYGASNSHSPWV